MNNSTKIVITIALILSLIGTTAPLVRAHDQPFHASTHCQPFYPFDGNPSSRLYGSVRGMENDLTGIGATATLTCNVDSQRSTLDSNDNIRVYYHDANDGTGGEFPSPEYSVSCQAWTMSLDHTTFRVVGAPRFGCSTVGGCPRKPDESYTGDGYILLEKVPHGPARMAHVVCQLPRRTTPTASAIYSLWLDER